MIAHEPSHKISYADTQKRLRQAIQKENLHAISSRIGKQKQMAALRVLLQLADNKSIEAIKAETHIGCAGSDENARRRA